MLQFPALALLHFWHLYKVQHSGHSYNFVYFLSCFSDFSAVYITSYIKVPLNVVTVLSLSEEIMELILTPKLSADRF